DLAALGIRQSDMARLGGPVDAHEPASLFFIHAILPRLGAAAMLADPCTGARRRRLPTGHPSRQPARALVPPRCSKHRGRLVTPGGLARPDQLKQAPIGSG